LKTFVSYSTNLATVFQLHMLYCVE